MGATLTINEGSTQMVRLVGDELVQEDAQRNLYTIPPKGEYEFMITGYALPFEMAIEEQYRQPGRPDRQTMTRLEFTITEGKGKGKMFTVLLGFSLGPKSNLGRFLRQLDVDLSPDDRGQWDLDRAIGYRGKGYFIPSEKLDETGKPKYVKLALDTGYKQLGAPERAYSIEITEAAPATNGNGHKAASDDGWE